MNRAILDRIVELGGDTRAAAGEQLVEYIYSIDLKCPLYKKPSEVPWSDNPEPIYGLGNYVDENIEFYKTDKSLFYENMVKYFFDNPNDHFGQTYFSPKLFTPLTEGTDDYKEWRSWFESSEVNLSVFKKFEFSHPLEFMELTNTNGYPNALYICTSDPDTENPRVFGTDHTVHFIEISEEGRLEDFFNKFMTKNEFLEIVISQMEEHYH